MNRLKFGLPETIIKRAQNHQAAKKQQTSLQETPSHVQSPQDQPQYYSIMQQYDGKLPHVVSVTFFRSGDLPLSLEAIEGGGVRVTEVFWIASPVDVGDFLVEVHANGKTCHPCQVLSVQGQRKLTGVVTLRFRKVEQQEGSNSSKSISKNLRGSFFVQPQAHTCLPMAFDFSCSNGTLSFSNLEETNDWLSNSYLEPGQAVVSINGSPSHQLEEEDAQRWLLTKLTMDPYLYIIAQRRFEVSSTPAEISIPTDPAMRRFLGREYDVLQQFLEATTSEQCLGTDRVSAEYRSFRSSKELFVTLLNSLQRLQNQRSCPPCAVVPILSQVVLPKALQAYATYMESLLPSTSLSSSSSKNVLGRIKRNRNPHRRPKPAYQVDTPDALTQVCQVIATCEYCAEQSQALEETIHERYPTTQSAIQLKESIEAFQEVIVKAMSILVSGIMHRLEDSFHTIRQSIKTKHHWKANKIKAAVDEESEYVQTMCQEMQSYVGTISQDQLMPRCYVRSFSDKFVRLFCTSYYDTCLPIVKKNVSHLAIQQLLLDVCYLKEQCLLLPSGDNIASYAVLVQSQFRTIEGLLKGKWMQ